MKSVGISPKYVSNWDIKRAVREIIQNALDVRDEYGCKAKVVKKKGKAIIKDNGPGMELKHFVMGISGKGADSRGQFGEGLKLALLVFARERREIKVKTGNKVITPVIEWSEEFEEELISLNVEETGHKVQGTRIEIEVTNDELRQGMLYFLEYHKKMVKFEWIKRNQFSISHSVQGSPIWVNNTLVSLKEDAICSYHLNGAEAKRIMNRDRDTIDGDKLENMVAEKICEEGNLKLVKLILSGVAERKNFWEANLPIYVHRIPRSKRRIWKQAVHELFGKNVVISSNPQADEKARYKGKKVIDTGSYKWDDFLIDLGFKKSDEFKESYKMERIRQKHLNTQERENLEWARSLVQKHYHNPGKINIVTEIKTGNDQDIQGDVLGAYDREKDKIYLARDILSDKSQLAKTLLHEVAHKVSQAGDCTAEFESALTSIAGELLMKLDT